MSALVMLVLAVSAPSNVGELLGVTKDGRYLAYVGGDGFDSPPVTVVQDLLTGTQKVFEDAEAWKQSHPLVELKPSRKSPDGKAMADVVAGDVTEAGSWVGDTWTNDSATAWSLVVTRNGAQHVAAYCAPAGSVDVYWTPDGRRTLWIAHHAGHAMRDPGYDEVVVGTDGNPGVSVAIDKSKLKDAEKISAALAKAGFTVLSVTPAKKARDKSVVFAAAGHEAEAKKLAAAVPGGADVQKLDWKSPLDLVVALGREALK